jgi:glutamine phosphoribosylpyrophosphate amidotransferase
MCGVIGACFAAPKPAELDLLVEVFLQSQIRGKHATGMTWLQGGVLKTIKEPVPAEVFVERHLQDPSQYLNEDGNLYLIGHCRYSTSDLEYNQPLATQDLALVHNGVISQELPENWESLYEVACETKNDTELLLRKRGNPFRDWLDSSIAAVELHADRTMIAYRNGKRPLYLTKVNNGQLITSTRDIALRSGVENDPVQLKMHYKTQLAPGSKVLSLLSPTAPQFQPDLQIKAPSNP